MWPVLWAKLLRELFGDGLGADVAARSTIYLVDEARKAVDREPERITGVRIQPGETYTVIARPPATRQERKLAAEQRRLQERDRAMARPGRKQLKSARRLKKAQRKLDRRRPGSRRYLRAAAAEEAAGARFDRVMRPSRKQAAVHTALQDTTSRLDDTRALSMDAAREKSGRGGRRSQTRVFD